MAKKQQVNSVSIASSKCEFIFSLVGETVHLVFKKGKTVDKVIITAEHWMRINKGMFNPGGDNTLIEQKDVN